MKTFLRSLIIFFAFTSSVKAQDFLGFSNSNWSGVTGIYYNPANIADNRMKFDMDLVGVNASFANNYVGLKHTALTDSGGHFPYLSNKTFSDKNFQRDYLTERVNNDPKSVFLGANIYLPSFMFKLNGKTTIGFSWRERNYMNADGFEQPLAHQMWTGIHDASQFHQKIDNAHLSIQYMSWAEYGFTFARNLYSKGPHFIKAGVTLKLLQGLGAAYMFVDNLHYDFSHHDTLSLFNSNVNYGHSTNFELSASNAKYKYISNINFGGDLGVIYEYRPEPKAFEEEMDGAVQTMSWENKYKIKVGAALVDLGYIKYQKGLYSHDFNANSSNWYTHNINLNHNVIGSLDDTLRNRFTMGSADKYFKMNLPTVMNLSLDYNIYKNFYANVDAFLAFKMNSNVHKVHEISTYSITPRWDHRWFGVFMPFSYNDYKNANIGLDIRLGPVILGANNLFEFFNTKDIYAVDFHIMFKVLVPYRKTHDRDGDHVSDKKDKCPDVAGVWEFQGCPDRDHDHIQDKDDSCPDEAGLPQFSGCPDRDGDGIPDKYDLCPDNPGLKEFHGCPDRDKDGIPDKDDACPDDPGVAYFHGCPDTDHDSIMDKDDKCPTKPGPIENHGCPYDKLYLIAADGTTLGEATIDKDGNFIFPNLPPDEKALFKLESYSDGPEIKEVKAGVTSALVRIAKKGPDSYFRFDILKPDEKKLKNSNEQDVKIVILTKQEEEVVKKAFDNLEFETGKDVIKSESYASLNELAGLMKKKPNWRLQISGHTDNQGTPASNMLLSKKRSIAVKKYLAAQGIADEKFIAKWYGQTKPVGDNKTEAGRQKNRRVEMLIIE